MDTKKSIKDYLDELSSSAPAPGGGNVAAFCGMLASSLGLMVCNLSSGKKFKSSEKEISSLKENMESFKSEFEELAKKDNEAFEKVIDSRNMPTESDTHKVKKRDAVENATFNAAIVPSDVIKKCKEVIPHLRELADTGNENAISDIGVAAKLIEAAAEGAFFNVIINCASLSNQFVANEFVNKTEVVLEEIKTSTESLIEDLLSKMRNK